MTRALLYCHSARRRYRPRSSRSKAPSGFRASRERHDLMVDSGIGSPRRTATAAAMSRIRRPSLRSLRTPPIASRISPTRRRLNCGLDGGAGGSSGAPWRTARSWIRWRRARRSGFQRLPTKPIPHLRGLKRISTTAAMRWRGTRPSGLARAYGCCSTARTFPDGSLNQAICGPGLRTIPFSSWSKPS